MAVETIDELFDVALLLHTRALPAGDRLVVVSDAVGPSPVSAVACAVAGLDLVDASVHRAGPLPGAAAEEWVDAVRHAASGDGADALLVVVTGTTDGDGVLDAVVGAGAEVEAPVAVVVLTGDAPAPIPAGSGGASVPCFPAPDRAVRALGRVARLSRWRRAAVAEDRAAEEASGAGATAVDGRG